MDSIGFHGGVATVKRVRKCISYHELRALDPGYELLAQCFFVLYRVGFNPDSDGFNWISWGCGHS